MSRVPALDRTTALLGGDLFPAMHRCAVAQELTATPVVIRADRANLASAAAQTALVTAFLCIAQCGLRIHLDIPDVEVIGSQPPLRGERLRSALLDLAGDLITPASTEAAPRGTAQIVLGDTPSRDEELLRIGGGPWRAELRLGPQARVEPLTGDLPIGAVLGGIAAAAELVRVAAAGIQRRHRFAVAGEFDLGGPRQVTLAVPALELPAELDVGEVDFISAGAITNGCLFSLLRCHGVRANTRVIDSDIGEETNLNRYALLRRSALETPKVDVLAGYSSERFRIEPVPRRLDASTAGYIAPLGACVIAGVDDIPSRWLVQSMYPEWLCVGGTGHFTVIVSEHAEGMPCAGCLHPEDDLDAPPELPTISFTSLLAGTLQAYRLLAHFATETPTPPTLAASFNLSAPYALDTIGLAARSDCPVRCPASRSATG